MNKKTRRILILLSPIIIIIIAILLQLYKYREEIGSMSPAKTQEITDNIFCIKDGYVNAYLFKTADGYLMFDAGNNEKKILAEMSKLDIDASEVKILLLTHSDTDHTAAIGSFKNAEVYMHKEEKQLVDGTSLRLGLMREWEFGEFKLFDSGELIEFGGLEIEVIHTPGHTPGSCCFIVNDKYFVTGDNLFIQDGDYIPFLEKFNADHKLNGESIQNLPGVEEFEYVLTGHGGVWKK